MNAMLKKGVVVILFSFVLGIVSTVGAEDSCSVVVWGGHKEDFGQRNVPAPNTGFVKVSASTWGHHSLGLKSDSSIVVWGQSDYGQCNVPLPNSGFVEIAGADNTSLGLKTDGSIVAWGVNDYGQCNVPAPNTGFVAVAGGLGHCLGLKSDGSIAAWGRNDDGQCNVPSPNMGFVAVSAGGRHSVGLKSDGSVVAWGRNDYGQCDVPAPNTGFTDVDADGDHCLGLKTGGSVVAWGRNNMGQCNVPLPNTGFVAVAAGAHFSLGLKSDGSVIAWGENDQGQCTVPTPNTGFVAISAGANFGVALGPDGGPFPPAAPASPVPNHEATGVPVSMDLNWSDCAYATSYDLYLWLASGSKPAMPTAQDLPSSVYDPPGDLQSDTTYRWQVIAKNEYGETAGPEWQLTTTTPGASTATPEFTQVLYGTMDGKRGPIYNGGQWKAYPAFGDVDGDGDLDLFIGNNQNVAYYRNDGTKTTPVWTFMGGNYIDLVSIVGIDVTNASPAMCDIDGDGYAELFVGVWRQSNPSHLLYFHNDGGHFNLVTMDFVPTSGGLVYPEFEDLDADGDFDLLIGYSDSWWTGDAGTVLYYRNDGTPQNPVMVPQGNVLGLDVRPWDWVAPELVDLDGDGDLDVILGLLAYHSGPSETDTVRRYENIGTPQSPIFVPREDDFLIKSRQPLPFGLRPNFTRAEAADLDGDQKVDLVFSDNPGIRASFRNTGTATAPVWMRDDGLVPKSDLSEGSAEPYHCLYDIDADGDLDLFVGGPNNVLFYRNVGSPTQATWEKVTNNFIDIPTTFSLKKMGVFPKICDIDGDGNGDMFLSSMEDYYPYGNFLFCENIGTPTSPQWSQAHMVEHWQGLQGDDGLLSFGDLDGDGDLDMISTTVPRLPYQVNIRYRQNIGSATNPVFSAPVDFLTPEYPPGGPHTWCAPSLVDMDRDGDLDVVVVANAMSGGFGLAWTNYFENTGTPFSPVFSSVPTANNLLPLDLHLRGSASVGDLNGDGYPDILASDNSAGVMYFQQSKTGIHIAPSSITTTPGGAITFQAEGYTAPLTWSFAKNSSGASPLVPSGSTASYTAGAAVGTVDAIEVRDSASKIGRAYVNVISASQLSASGKAVVIAGRKADDPLWASTNNLAHYVFRTLLYRGFSKENVQYLNPDTAQDVDGNGNAGDDIDGASSLAAAQQALTTGVTAGGGCSTLFVYMIDHGEADASGANGRFRLNETELLSASQLDGWLDALQSSGGVTTLTLMVDCCQAGSFLKACSGAPAGKARVVVASATATQPAFFSAGGLISFTNSFVGALCSGLTVGQAFDLAAGGMDRYQQPALDDDGDGVYDKDKDGAVARRLGVGASFIAGADRPQIGKICANQSLTGGDAGATIWASDVSAVYPVDRVWATIAAPGFISDAQIEPGQPVTGLPELELTWNVAQSRYEATTNTFTQMGAYAVNIYAEDIWGGVAYPKQTYVNQATSDEGMAIVCGNGAYDSNSPWAFSDYLAASVYETARARWLAHDKIAYLTSAANTADRPVDGPPTQGNLQSAIAATAGMSKLTVYLVGRGSGTAFDIDGDGAASDPDDVTPAELDSWLDAAQSSGDTTAIVVLDFTQSGAWVAPLQAPTGKKRIVITSCSGSEASWCEGGGVLSFTQWFFAKVFNGVNLRDAFNWSRLAIRAVTGETQNPTLDDDGSGVADPRVDGLLAKGTYIGAAFVTGAETPAIGDYAKNIVLTSNSSTLWASGVWSPDGIAGAYAYVIKPGATAENDQTERVDLTYNASNGRWEATYSNFNPALYHRVVYFAEGRGGELSPPYSTLAGPSPEEDLYDRLYNDNTTATLNFISAGNWSQKHNLWMPGDEDWAVFNADADSFYSILVTNQSSACDAAIYLYHASNLSTPLVTRDDNGPGGDDEMISWFSGTTTGTMYVKVTQSPYSPGLSGDETSYTLQVYAEKGPNAGLATISGTQIMAGAAACCLRAGPGGIYTKPQQDIPAGCLVSETEFVLDDPGDIGNQPYFASTSSWLAAHPGNASIVQILTPQSVSFQTPVTLTLQFVDNGPTDPELNFTVDDLPPGADASKMKIHQWTGSCWEVVPGTQTVSGDTVTVSMNAFNWTSLERCRAAVFAVAPAVEPPKTTSVHSDWRLYE